MKIALHVLALAALAIAGVSIPAPAQAADEHKMVMPQDVQWAPAPNSIPKGAEAALLYGDPGKDELFILRLKFPAGYTVSPHTHPKPEIVTVLSGTLHLGMGETADRSKTQAVPAGSFFALPPGTPHFAFTDEETVLQLSSSGPWALNYINPEDDPRNQ